MVVSGAPDKTRYHALHICDMSLDMLDAMNELRDPSTDGHMKIRVGRLHVLQTQCYFKSAQAFCQNDMVQEGRSEICEQISYRQSVLKFNTVRLSV